MEREISRGFVGWMPHAEEARTVHRACEAGARRTTYVGKASAKVTELNGPLSKLGRTGHRLLIVYEAGPVRVRIGQGAEGGRVTAAEVIAPSNDSQEIRGSDQRPIGANALKLASLARAGELVAVLIPDERDEAIRDLSRARVDCVRARLKARQQLRGSAAAPRPAVYGKSSWTAAHERYLAENHVQAPRPRTSPMPSIAMQWAKAKRGCNA